MTREEQDEKEFEEEWEKNNHKPLGYVPLVFLDALKEMSKQYWLASRKTLRENEMRTREVMRKVLKEVKEEMK